MHITNLLC
jgi:hypothetical protein